MGNLFDVTGKRAIVTGGTRGLGHGMAEGLLEAGAEVTIFGTRETTTTVAADFAAKGYKAHGIIVDIGDREACAAAFAKAVETMGGLDILVNSAGVQARHPSEEFPMEDWDYVLNVNLNATFQLCQLAGRQFLEQGHGGKIVNVASMLSFFGGLTVSAYAASKGGVAQLTKALSNEWASKGINVNAVAPGYMDTDMNVALTDPSNPRYEVITNRIPAKRWGTGDDMKGITVFLSSAASDYLDGAVIPVDGGYLVM